MREGAHHSLPHNPEIPFSQAPTKQRHLLLEEPASSSSPQQKAIKGGRIAERGRENQGNTEAARSLKVIYCSTATRREDFTHHTGQHFPPKGSGGSPRPRLAQKQPPKAAHDGNPPLAAPGPRGIFLPLPEAAGAATIEWGGGRWAGGVTLLCSPHTPSGGLAHHHDNDQSTCPFPP